MNTTDFLPICKKVMLSNGLRIARTPTTAFDWDLTVSNILVQLRIERFDPTFIRLPRVTFRNIADLPTNLIHVNFDKSLCYLDTAGVYLDPFTPEITLTIILKSIKKTLKLITTPENFQRDFLLEFDAYWQANVDCYLLTSSNDQQAVTYTRKDSALGNRIEFAVSSIDNKSKLEKWLKIRKVANIDDVKQFAVINVGFSKPPLLKLNSDLEWPPKDWRTFYKWLLENHLPIANELANKLCQKLAKSNKLLFLLFTYQSHDSGQSCYFGVYVKFLNTLKDLAKRYEGSKKPGKRKGKVKLQSVRDGLKSIKTEIFTRIQIQNAAEEFILSRNLPTTNLNGTRIAIIGAGTVGSHLISLLVKSGAGTGTNATLDIFDSDVLTTANISRHLLNEEYLGNNKAIALQHHLTELFSWELRIKPFNAVRHKIQIYKMFEYYDIIIDATGEQQFSTLLTSLFRQYSRTAKTSYANILSGWVDANGLAARTLLDDGKLGCYRCLKQNRNGALIERYPLKSNSNPWPTYAVRQFACGDSFTPYAESVSLSAASLLHSAVLDFFNDVKTPRFRHLSLHPSVPIAKSQNIKQLQDCPCCK